MPELIIAPAARADLLAQSDYYSSEAGRPDVADRFRAGAETTFKNLANTPGLGRPRAFGNTRLQNLRSWRVTDFPQHLVFYRPLPEDRGVEIVRVLHGARDLETLFK